MKNEISMKTSNSNLQNQFAAWVAALSAALSLADPSKERTDAITEFCRTFVPSDVTEDDIQHFSTNLITDAEFAESILREVSQCEVGDCVERIEGNQRTRAEFTVLPADGTGEIDRVSMCNAQCAVHIISWTTTSLELYCYATL